MPVEAINRQWRDLIQAMRKVNQSLAALLSDARPLGADAQDYLVLGFQHAFHCNKVNEEANRQIVEQTASQHFGQPIRVRCVLEKDWTPPAVPASRPAAPPPPPDEPPTDPLADDLVQRAVTQLGARPKVVSG